MDEAAAPVPVPATAPTITAVEWIAPAQTTTHVARDAFLTANMDLAPALEDTGFQTVTGSKASGSTADVTWPGESRWRINIRAGAEHDGFRAMIYVSGGDTTEENEATLAEIAAHAHLLDAEVEATGGSVDWNHHVDNEHAKVAALACATWPAMGYGTDPELAAERLVAFGRGVARTVTAGPDRRQRSAGTEGACDRSAGATSTDRAARRRPMPPAAQMSLSSRW